VSSGRCVAENAPRGLKVLESCKNPLEDGFDGFANRKKGVVKRCLHRLLFAFAE